MSWPQMCEGFIESLNCMFLKSITLCQLAAKPLFELHVSKKYSTLCQLAAKPQLLKSLMLD